MKLIFAKTKRARAVCAVLAVISLALAALAGYFAVGNLICADEGPVLIADSGGAVFLGYYLLAGAYFTFCAISLLLCALFTLNSIKAFIH